MSSQPAPGDKPALVIIAGPNGSGKSSAYRNAKLEWDNRDVWINNPDLLTLRLINAENLEILEANLEAVKRIESWLYASIDVHQTIGVETVLSTGKYRTLVEAAKKRGFDVWLIYVILDSPERNVERVKIRAKSGGHNVDPKKIRERYKRSVEEFPWFLDACDRGWVYDNSGAEPKLIATKANGEVVLDKFALDVIKSAVETIQSE